MLEIPIPVRADLDRSIKKTYLDTIFATEDDKAHRFDVSLYLDKKPLELPSGASVSAYFIRYCDNGTLPLTGEASGNVASVTLTKACYNKSGAFALIIKVLEGDVTSTVFYGEGSMFVSRTDTLIDTENVIPSLEELLAMVDVMEKATAESQTATASATKAAEDANKAAQWANEEAEAAQGWADATTTTVTLEAGEDADVNLSTAESGAKVLEFSIPRGESGVYIGPDEPTDPTVQVWIDSDGEADELPSGVTPEEIQAAVDSYLDENPVTPGATAEEAAQIQANTEAINELNTAINNLSGSGGLTQSEKNNLLMLLESVAIAHYSEDVTAAFNSLKSAWSVSESIPATGITLNPTVLTFDAATSQKITATLEPPDATTGIQWSSDDEDVAYVENGTVYAVANGTATITAMAGSVTATCSVNVNIAATVYSVTYNLTNVTSSTDASSVTEGESFTATITAKEGYKLASVTYTMAGGSAVTVSDGVISIASVLGDIIINATATAEGSEDNPTAWVSGVPYVYDLIADTYYQSTNGSVLTYQGWSRTPLLPCKGAKEINFTLVKSYNSTYNLFYDENKEAISGSSFSVYLSMPNIAVPENACYLGVSNESEVMEQMTITPIGE